MKKVLDATIKSGKDTKIGNSAKTGWELLIPDGVMEDGTSITMEVLSAENAKSYQSCDFMLYVEPGYVTAGAIRYKNKDGKDSFTIDTYKTVKIYSFSETLTATAPTGSKAGDKIALRTTFSGSQQGTCYIYEWKQVE